MGPDEVPSEPVPTSNAVINEPMTMQVAMDKLYLPSRLNFTKPPLTSFQASNNYHMVELIDLSGFRNNVINNFTQGCTKGLLRELMSRVVEMRCLKAMSLRDNGIG